MTPKKLNGMIDGNPVTFEEGQTILEVARDHGIEIPTLCHREGLSPEGGCRICMVECGGEGRMEGACHKPMAQGLTVQTHSERLQTLRRDILDLYLSEYPNETFREQDNEVRRLIESVGLQKTTYPAIREKKEWDASHPYMRFNETICINCRRCLHACEEWQGQFVYGMTGRGSSTTLSFGPNAVFDDSPCVSCGACVDSCPTGAISDIDRMAWLMTDAPIRTTCGYCGVGCQFDVSVRNEKVQSIRGTENAEVNHGHLCVKGRYAHAYHHSNDRLTKPLLKVGNDWKEISWEEANAWAAKRLTELKEKYGPDSIGAFTSSRSTNEAAYLLQKMFRVQLETNNVDCCARVCHSSTALALQKVTGTGAASASYVDIERAQTIVIAGANPTEAHPVVGARLKQAVLNGAKLIVIDPREIELAKYADIHLQLYPGTNVALFNALAKVMIDRKLVNREYIDARTEGFGELVTFLKDVRLLDVSEITRVPVEQMEKAGQLLGEAAPVLFVHGLGLSELTQGTASVMTLCNLGMLTGSIGFPGAGMLPLRGQNNVQGNADMGGMPNQVTGYQPINDVLVRERCEREWGKAPPEKAGLTISEMIHAATEGSIHGLWIQGEDVVQSDPNESHVIKALSSLDLLIVQEMFMSETCKYAHLVLPAAGALEKDGTFTNGERRIQLIRPVVPAPGEAKPDWVMVQDVANELGAHWNYAGPAEVMDEIARVAPRLFGGVSYDRLGDDGLQWPCPRPDHPGTSTVHAQGFLRGKGQLVTIDFVPSPEHNVEDFPYTLVTGRVLDHYNVGTMTRRTPNRDIVGADYLEIHPTDAEKEHIVANSEVEVESCWGKIVVPVEYSERVSSGTMFLSFHYPETHANRLTSSHVDPESKCPEYKVTAIRVRPVASQ